MSQDNSDKVFQTRRNSSRVGKSMGTRGGPQLVTGFRKVKGVGRHTSRIYCDTCGLKRKDCTCAK